MTDATPRKRRSRTRQKPAPLQTAVAAAPQINIFTLPTYVPDERRSVRAGADDHLKHHSRGVRA